MINSNDNYLITVWRLQVKEQFNDLKSHIFRGDREFTEYESWDCCFVDSYVVFMKSKTAKEFSVNEVWNRIFEGSIFV